MSNATFILTPRVSEKAYDLSKDRNVYVFEVAKNVNKQQIAEAVEGQFNVTVVSVNILIAKGKVKRMINKRGRAAFGKRNDVKRAYVTIKAGDHIPVFAAIDEAQEKAEKAAKKGRK